MKLKFSLFEKLKCFGSNTVVLLILIIGLPGKQKPLWFTNTLKGKAQVNKGFYKKHSFILSSTRLLGFSTFKTYVLDSNHNRWSVNGPKLQGFCLYLFESWSRIKGDRNSDSRLVAPGLEYVKIDYSTSSEPIFWAYAICKQYKFLQINADTVSKKKPKNWWSLRGSCMQYGQVECC